MQQRNAKPGPVGVFRLTLQLIVFLAASSAAIPLARAQSSVAVPPAGAQEPVDPTGPIENVGMNVIADDQGVQAPGYHFVDTAAKAHAWQAKWIWPSGDAGKANAACFRKEIELADAPTQVNAWMTADIKYRLYVNGRLVVRGPVDIGMDYAGGNTHRWFYDWRDLTPFFHQGKNVISAEVFRNWPAGRTISRGKPGFLFEAAVVLPGKRTISVKSDATWKSIAAPQFPDANVYDATKEPAGWRMAGFDDSAWGAPEVVSDVWSPLVPSEIPPLMEARYPVLRVEGLPDDKTITKDSTFTVVFNRVLSAYPILKFKGGKGAVAIVKGHEQAIVVLGDGETNFEFPWMTEVVPSYTVELRNVSSPVQVEDAGAVFTSQPVEYRGSFSCSDDGLNQIWKTCRWTVQINLQTHHMDSPNHQEPICDPGDYVIESMVNDYAFAQPWLTRQDIRKFAWLLKDEKYHNFHTSYSIAWLQMLMDYYDYTGDKALVDEMSPYVYELLDTYATWRGKNGIISEAPNYMFMDWVTIGGFALHHPPAVIGQGYLTALYYHGMEMASRVAALKGDTERVRTYAYRRRQIAEAFNRELWVADKGLYRDGKPNQSTVPPGAWLPADTNIETFSPHVNLLAVLFDLAPKQRQAAIVRKVLEEKPLNTQPWFMHWVFPAIDHAGLFGEYGTEQMRRWQIQEPTQSFLEMWNTGDLSHGWCSTPLVQMSERVLGVAPMSPGFKTINVRPQVCDLTWAKGIVPTPLGNVSVDWRIADGKLMLDVTVPPGATADVTAPIRRFENPSITLDGKAGAAEMKVAAGEHHFVVSGTLKPLVTASE